jgi:hypothetical protein
MKSLEELADLCTVEEAALFLRIGRGMAYRAARRYLDTDGRVGLPVIQLGRHFRVPKVLLARLLNGDLALEEPCPPSRSSTPRPSTPQDVIRLHAPGERSER